jgi:orotate phosphoribosyltransferase
MLRTVTSDWDYTAVGGLTLGADPVAAAVMHAASGSLDAFLVRKTEKQHGMLRRIEGPPVAGRDVLIVEDVSTTGSSPLTAARAATEAGARVAGVALIVDRGGCRAVAAAGFACRAVYSLDDLGLS